MWAGLKSPQSWFVQASLRHDWQFATDRIASFDSKQRSENPHVTTINVRDVKIERLAGLVMSRGWIDGREGA
jgi:hypothetical protein